MAMIEKVNEKTRTKAGFGMTINFRTHKNFGGVALKRTPSTTKTQRTQRTHRENGNSNTSPLEDYLKLTAVCVYAHSQLQQFKSQLN